MGLVRFIPKLIFDCSTERFIHKYEKWRTRSTDKISEVILHFASVQSNSVGLEGSFQSMVNRSVVACSWSFWEKKTTLKFYPPGFLKLQTWFWNCVLSEFYTFYYHVCSTNGKSLNTQFQPYQILKIDLWVLEIRQWCYASSIELKSLFVLTPHHVLSNLPILLA